MKTRLRLLKFDSVYPLSFLEREHIERREYFLGLSYEEYCHWFVRQRTGLSDFLTYYMTEAGWGACLNWPQARLVAAHRDRLG